MSRLGALRQPYTTFRCTRQAWDTMSGFGPSLHLPHRKPHQQSETKRPALNAPVRRFGPSGNSNRQATLVPGDTAGLIQSGARERAARGSIIMGAKQFGASVARVEDPFLLNGRARFVDDIKLPGLLHACFVRSPHPHARIGAIDAAAARAMTGIHAVLTADDMPGRLATDPIPTPVPHPAITAMRTQPALAHREVCYVGETIAVVIADNRYAAEDAAAAVVVDYEVLPAISDCRAALAASAPPSHSDLATNVAAFIPMAYGDVERDFDTA